MTSTVQGPTPTDLERLASSLRDAPAVRAKAEIGLVAEVLGGTDWYAGPGDDGAVLPARATGSRGRRWRGDPARVRGRRSLRRRGRRRPGQRERPGRDGSETRRAARHRRRPAGRGAGGPARAALGGGSLRRAGRGRPSHPNRRARPRCPAFGVGRADRVLSATQRGRRSDAGPRLLRRGSDAVGLPVLPFVRRSVATGWRETSGCSPTSRPARPSPPRRTSAWPASWGRSACCWSPTSSA